MPIIVKDYNWEQDKDNIYIQLPLKGTKSSKVDIFSTEFYLKISYQPYLCEYFFRHSVKDNESCAKIGDGLINIKLEKCVSEIWDNLQIDELTDKMHLRQLRQKASDFVRDRLERERKEKEESKRESDRLAVKQQMDLEDNERKRISELKEFEKQQALSEIQQFQEKEKMENQKLLEEHLKRYENATEYIKNPIFTPNSLINGNHENDEIVNKKTFQLRESGQINVKFTPRHFPTAARESQLKDEEEWLAKQQQAKKVIDLEDEDLTESEKNPDFLRDKANAFFKNGDYQSAIAVYTHAIRLNPKLPSLYSNRAACHLKIRNLFKCLEDSSKALELLTPPVQQNANSRLKSHIRRGTAFCQLECYVEALQDYEAALKITPNDEKLKIDADNIRKIIQGSI